MNRKRNFPSPIIENKISQTTRSSKSKSPSPSPSPVVIEKVDPETNVRSSPIVDEKAESDIHVLRLVLNGDPELPERFEILRKSPERETEISTKLDFEKSPKSNSGHTEKISPFRPRLPEPENSEADSNKTHDVHRKYSEPSRPISEKSRDRDSPIPRQKRSSFPSTTTERLFQKRKLRRIALPNPDPAVDRRQIFNDDVESNDVSLDYELMRNDALDVTTSSPNKIELVLKDDNASAPSNTSESSETESEMSNSSTPYAAADYVTSINVEEGFESDNPTESDAIKNHQRVRFFRLLFSRFNLFKYA